MRKSVEGIFQAGGVLIEGKAQLVHGEFIDWVTNDLKLGEGKVGMRKAQMLMNIARHPILSKANQWFAFPPSWRTIHEISLIRPKSRLLAFIANGKINSGMTREEVIALRKGNDHSQEDNGGARFFLNAVIAQLQSHITPLSDFDVSRELRAERSRMTAETVHQLKRLTRLTAEVVRR